MSEPEIQNLKYRIGGMDCASCATKIENAVGRLPGVSEVGVSVTAGTLTVKGTDMAEDAVERQVKALGYSIGALRGTSAVADRPHIHEHEHEHEHEHGDHDHFELGQGPWWKSRKAALALVTAAALTLTYVAQLLFPAIPQWIFVPALAVGLVPIAQRAYAAAITGTPFSIETLMTIAASGAYFIGAAEEAVIVVLLFLVGELLEGVAASRARASIRGLIRLVPKTAMAEIDGRTVEVAAESLEVGSIVIARPGDRIAADGIILAGSSAINEAPVTGESLPRTKNPGDIVFAGTFNTDAVLRIKVTAGAADNTIARVVKLVEEAQESKAPTARFIDRFSTYYTPAVLVVGILVALLPPLAMGQSWPEWIYKGLAVLLIGCPCALVISTPAAIAAGLSAGARRGLLIKGGAVMERLRDIDVVALDKTGTLTIGKPEVTDIVGMGRSEASVLSLAAAIETGSSHPLALAILARARTDKVPVPPVASARAIPGNGVTGSVGGELIRLISPKAAQDAGLLDDAQLERIDGLNAEGKTVSVLLADDAVAGLLAMRDEARPDALAGLQALTSQGIGIVMLTGDNERAARAIGAELGIEVRASLLPEDKQNLIRDMQRRGQVVAKVGDGINDAPALAAADIGIAMGGGTDVALETANAAILHGRVTDIADMIALSKATMGNIRQNIAVALGLKAVFLVTTIIGVTGLWPAILADTGATVLVTANAMRLLAWRPARSARDKATPVQ
jgi:Cd2+/Zn2+-exporting ATPase